MDDEALKNPRGPCHDDYFEKLLARIRDIRSSGSGITMKTFLKKRSRFLKCEPKIASGIRD